MMGSFSKPRAHQKVNRTAETLLCGDEGRKKGEQEVSSLQVEDFLSD